MQAFNHDCVLPATAAKVLAAIASEDYLRFRYADEDGHELHIQVEQDDAQAFVCVLTRSGSSEKLPGFARKLVGERLTMIQHQRWDRDTTPYRGHLRVQLEGLPGHVHTELRLSDNADGTATLAAHGELEARIPLLGRQIEKMLIGRAQETFRKSTQAIREYVQRLA